MQGSSWHSIFGIQYERKDTPMISALMGRTSEQKTSTSFARRFMMTAALAALPAMASADPFFKLNNPGDPNFNQLLGISGRIIVGYFGDGAVVANNGYVLVPKNHY